MIEDKTNSPPPEEQSDAEKRDEDIPSFEEEIPFSELPEQEILPEEPTEPSEESISEETPPEESEKQIEPKKNSEEKVSEETPPAEPPVAEQPEEQAVATPPEEAVEQETVTEEVPEEAAHVDFDLLDTEGRWLLKVLSGPNTGAEFAMHGGSSYLIGTDTQQCDIVFQDLSVSRKHARLTIDLKEKATLEDLSSRNGTFVDGEKTDKKSITGNVLVSMGTTTFMLIDREAERTTIVAPSIHEKAPEVPEPVKKGEEPPRTEQAPLGPIQQAVFAPLQSEVERVKEEERLQAKVSHAVSSLVILAVVTGLIMVIGIGTTFLFRTEEVATPQVVDPEREISHALSEFPAIRYSFNPSTNRLMLVGHVLTPTDASKMVDILQQLKFLSSIDYSNVVIDDLVRQEINQVIQKNPKWHSITITSPQAGRFILTGFLKTKAEGEELYDYISQNFAYIDLLERRVVVEEDLLAQVSRELNEAGFKGVTPSLSGGDLTLTGSITTGTNERFQKLVSVFRSLPGIRGVQLQVSEAGQAEAVVDISSKYVVSGYSQQGKRVSVVINGRILAPGDLLDGMFITDITPTTVFLEKNGVKYKIEFNR